MPFEERNIRHNVSWIDDVINLGSQSTPTTVITQDDGSTQVVIGFQRPALEEALQK
ncbi:MAG: glutaredoxin family protein [Sulfobacillus benefaciens]|uniref:Glutaredoxin family protein n=1 Tax=Sulfobacillus benefaciens TaxID=453960 RepID=A0A2T2XEK8_9FIRM|nr:MAG: glutaredoxin family protein [Sulfobacillus benefaciens]